MKNTLILLFTIVLSIPSFAQKGKWQKLSDGKTFNNWHIYNHPDEPISGKWKVENKAFVFDPSGASEWKINDLVTDQEYDNFEMTVQWKIEKGGNSGIFFGIKEDQKLRTPYMSGPEIQVLDDENHPDAKKGKNGNRKAGSLYDMIPSASKAKPYDNWNKVKIVKKDGILTVFQNGKLAVSFSTEGDKWNSMVEDSKFKGWEHFGMYTKGKIGLQDHGNIVAFRKIKIRQI